MNRTHTATATAKLQPLRRQNPHELELLGEKTEKALRDLIANTGQPRIVGVRIVLIGHPHHVLQMLFALENGIVLEIPGQTIKGTLAVKIRGTRESLAFAKNITRDRKTRALYSHALRDLKRWGTDLPHVW
ncbi:MAG: hypothetical protein V1723_01635 [Candidatus Uhrbacteria bacterium]